jgi:NitT/TauT family transport system ATP-binding protein
VHLLSGFAEAVAAPPYAGKADLPVIASALQMEVDDLFPVAETLQMLRFALIEGGDISLSDAGRSFAVADTDERKRLFARHLLAYVPLAAHVRRILDERASHTAPKSRFLRELEDHMTADAAEQTLRAVIGWGRYAEVFAYNARKMTFSLENP